MISINKITQFIHYICYMFLHITFFDIHLATVFWRGGLLYILCQYCCNCLNIYVHNYFSSFQGFVCVKDAWCRRKSRVKVSFLCWIIQFENIQPWSIYQTQSHEFFLFSKLNCKNRTKQKNTTGNLIIYK